jgi:hypothetical protein
LYPLQLNGQNIPSTPVGWGIFVPVSCIGNEEREIKFTKKEVSMKKMTMTLIMLLMLALIAGAETHEERQYINLSFTVWQLENGAKEAITRINTPIPEVLRESWIHDFVSLDITDGIAVTKVVENDGLRFVLIAEPNIKLTIQVFEKEKELFRVIHNKPSTVDTIFYGSDRKTYMMELTYTADNHPIGLVSPGIRK